MKGETRSNPEKHALMQRNVAEAQRMVLTRSQARWGSSSGGENFVKSSDFKFDEILGHPMVMLLFICLACMAWLHPAFGESSLTAKSIEPLIMAAFAHFLALVCIAFSVLGLCLRVLSIRKSEK